MNTKFGVHHPSDYYWKPENLIEFCEDLVRHGVSWYTLWANDLHLLEFCKALVDHGIEIVYRPGLMRIPSPLHGDILGEYRRVGAKYCQFYNEPNLFDEWKDSHRPISPEEFARLWEPRCRGLKDLGFIPVIPPLSPGGNIYHPNFFRRMVNYWKANTDVDELLSGCVLGIHNRPTRNPPDSEDVCSFNGYKWYRETMQQLLGYSLPMVAPEAGYQPEDMELPGGGYGWETWQNWNLELIRRFRPDHPKYVGDDFLAHIFWILQDPGSTWDHCGLKENWFFNNDTGQGRETNLWKALEAEDWGSVPAPPPAPPPPPPPLPPPPEGDVQLVGLSEEMKDYLVIKPAPQPSEPYWKIIRIAVDPSLDKMSAFADTITRDVAVRFYWADGESVQEQKLDGYAPLPKSAQMPMFNAWGSYGAEVYEENSEAVEGFGLYGDNLELTYTAHHPVMLTFVWVGSEAPPEPPDPPEPVPPSEDDYRLVLRLKQAPGFQDRRGEIEALAGTDMAGLERTAKRDLDGNPLFHWTEYIVIHHSGNPLVPQTPMSIARQALDAGKKTIAYNFVIDRDAVIHFTARLVWTLDHTAGFDEKSLGVCVIGDYTVEEYTQAQLEAVRFVVAGLLEFFGQGWGQQRLVGVVAHRDLKGNSTACPGNIWPADLWEGAPWPRLSGPV